MNTIKVTNAKAVEFIAHRGLSGLETENTNAAFVAAGNRASYFGIETDVHRTADGEFVIIHDDNTGRVSNVNVQVETSTMAELQKVRLNHPHTTTPRDDLRLPTMEDYIGICKQYEKIAVLELKNDFDEAEIAEILRRIEALDYLENTIFISFIYEPLLRVKAARPTQQVQFLTVARDDMDWLIGELARNGMDIDIQWGGVNAAFVEKCRKAGVRINCWTVDHPDDARRLIDLGVDFITSNILEKA